MSAAVARSPLAVPSIVVLLASSTLLASCHRATSPRETAPPDTLRIGLVSLPAMPGNPFSSLGIPSIFTWSAMFDALVHVSTDGKLEPALATRWLRIDEHTWDFELRQGVRFHNGALFDANAVVATVNYLTSPAARRESIAREMAPIESAEALGPYSVRFRTRDPAPLLPQLVGMMPIVEPGAWARLGRDRFSETPVGTGPYRLIRWRPNGAELEAWQGTWRPARMKRLDLRVIPDPIARVQALQSGAVDVAVQLSPDDAPLLELAGARLDVAPTTGVMGLTFILTQLPQGHPLHDRRVRQARNYAVNKEAMARAIFGGTTRPASQPATRGIVGFDPDLKPYAYDPERARILLAEAGFAKGFEFSAEVVIGAGAGDGPVFQSVAADLRKVGVRVTLIAIPLAQFVRNIQSGKWRSQAFGMNYNAERSMDALRFTRLHSCSQRHPWYCDRALSEEIRATNTEADATRRAERASAILRRYRDEAPAIWLHEITYSQGVSARIEGFRQDHAWLAYERMWRRPI